MMSLRDIEALADEAAERAAEEHLTPYVPFDAEEVQRYGRDLRLPFPSIGSYRPPGWRLVDTLFVDSSGFGREDEPALTFRGFRERLLQGIADGRQHGYAIIEEGQFQVVIGRFERTAPRRRSTYPLAGRREVRPQASARVRRLPERSPKP